MFSKKLQGWFSKSGRCCHYFKRPRVEQQRKHVLKTQPESKFEVGTVGSRIQQDSLSHVYYNSSPLNHTFETKPNDNRPYLKIKIFDDEILCLADSGSCRSVMGFSGLSLLRKWNVDIKNDDTLQITTADGVLQKCLGYAILPISLSGNSKNITVLITPSVRHQLILGVDFLIAFRVKANFSDLSYNFEYRDDICVVNSIKSCDDLTAD